MPTKNFVFRGKAVYPMLIKPDEYRGAKSWKIGLKMDEPSKKLFRLTGLRLKFREIDDDDLSPYVVFRRKIDGRFVTEDDPPVIDGWDPDEGAIGNGSLVEVYVQVYDLRDGGKGHRLQRVKVLDLVPYKGKTSQTVETIRPEDIEDVEDNEKTSKPRKKTAKKVKLDDEIPF